MNFDHQRQGNSDVDDIHLITFMYRGTEIREPLFEPKLKDIAHEDIKRRGVFPRAVLVRPWYGIRHVDDVNTEHKAMAS